MSKLPQISGRRCVKVLKELGFYFRRQEGSHLVLRKNNPISQLVIPDHKELDKGTLRAILKQAGISVDEFIKLNRKR